MAFQAIKRVSASEQVFEQIKKMILDGEWKSGDRIPPENELAGQIGRAHV